MRPRFIRSVDGAVTVEFAIVTAVFLLLLLGGIQFGMICWEKNTVAAAARDGARYAMVRGAESGRTADTSMVASYVRSRASLSPLKVTTTWPTTKNPGDIVQVRV